jgi:hypothetical protein
VGIALVRLPQFKLNLTIYTRRVEREELLDFYRQIDPYDPANAAALITYMGPAVDLSGLDLAAFAELKRVLASKFAVLANNPDFHCIIICSSLQCAAITRFWRAYLARDPNFPELPMFFPTLKRACDWLKLPPGAFEAASEAIRAHLPASTADAKVADEGVFLGSGLGSGASA